MGRSKPTDRLKDILMSGQTDTSPNTASPKSNEPRQRSSIAFPYMDLSSAITLAEAIFQNAGIGECEDDQLAAWTNQSSKSSTFRVQVYTARTFGVLSGEGSRHKLTDLGLAVVDQHRSREAKVQAFLFVPLYRAVFEKFKGGALPPPAALEREFITLGVAPKQKDRARQAFERSADQAGFFEHGKDRLIQPGITGSNPPQSTKNNQTPKGGSGGGGGDELDLDPVVAALVKKLPRKDVAFNADARIRWLQMMEMAFQDAYGEVETIEIKKSTNN